VQGPEDQEFVKAIAQTCPNLKIISPANIGQLAALIAGASLMICTDSAPMHLAVAIQTYTVALFGPTDPAKLLPSTDKCIGIQSPTGKMADIDPAQVLKAIWSEG
jgi:ADP-heptose:LPS heptosyltransferase